MSVQLGDFPVDSTVYVDIESYDSNGASVTLTGLAVTDVEIYKDSSMTQRASDAGITLLDTDGIDLDGVTGIHGLTIDLSDNTDAGFYAAGSSYRIVIASVTIDSQTVNLSYRFTIEQTNGAIARLKAVPAVNVTQWNSSAVATPTTAGVPEVDLTHVAGSLVATGSAQLGVNVVNAAGTAWGSGAITAGVIAADAIGASELAADAVAEIADAVWDEATVGHTTSGTFGEQLKTDVDAILVDTAEIGTAGAGLTDLGGMSTTMKAQVNTEALDVINTDTFAEPSAVPAATASLVAKVGWLYTLARNKLTQTATTQTLRNDADSGNIGTAAVSDDGTTATRDEWA